MNYIVIIYLLSVFFFVRKSNKCPLHPAAVSSFVWVLILVLYEVTDHGLWPLSDLFYAAFLAWIVPFHIACCMVIRLTDNDRHPLHPVTSLATSGYVVFFVAVCTVFAILLNIQRVDSVSLSDFLATIREQTMAVTRGEIPPPPMWIRFITAVANFGYVVVLWHCMKGIRFRYQFLFVFLVIGWILMGANKASLLRLGLGYMGILIFNKKLNISRSLFFILIICILMIVIQVFRDDIADIDFPKVLYFVKIYLLSPLTAFDHYILHNSTDLTMYFNGEFVFKDFSFVGNLFSDHYEKANVNYFNNELVYVPWGTNVYTAMSGYWVGWKWTGLIAGGIVHGCFWGYVYKRAESAEVYKLCYVAILYILVFQFFYDYLISRSVLFVFLYLFLFFFNSCLNIRKNRLTS